MRKRRIAITMGEPGGIGPEVALKAASDEKVIEIAEPVIVGDSAVLEEARAILGLDVELRKNRSPEKGEYEKGIVNFIQAGEAAAYIPGEPTADGGWASYESINEAATYTLEGRVDAMVTAPISKEALNLAGLSWPGHTEMLAELTGATEFAMAFSGGPLRLVLATIHLALKDVPSLITRKRVLSSIRMAGLACWMLGYEHPKIGVAALNPHSGEGGLFGDEEQLEILPAVEDAAAMGLNVTGPHPADTLFYRASKGEVDIVVAMYHDQGLTAFKLIAFDSGVNFTIGLPIIRTSPDHGTAYDIAWKDGGAANPQSMIEAVKLAARLRNPSRAPRPFSR